MTACFFFPFGMSYSEGVRGAKNGRMTEGAGGLSRGRLIVLLWWTF